jgi:hypothetical protein
MRVCGVPASAGALCGDDQTLVHRNSRNAPGLLGRAEVEVDDDVGRVVGRAEDAVVLDAGLPALFFEPVERGLPHPVVGDCVLHMQGGHACMLDQPDWVVPSQMLGFVAA